MMDDVCRINTQCQNHAEFYCNCGIILCEDHLSEHIKGSNQHSLSNLWEYLSVDEINSLKNLMLYLDESLLEKSKCLDRALSELEGKLSNNMQRAKDFNGIEKEDCIARKEHLQSIFI